MSSYDYARLRPIEVKRIIHQERPFFYLRDPLELSPHYALVPQALGLMLAGCNGAHTLLEIQQMIMAKMGMYISQTEMEGLLGQLDEIFLLDNDRAATAMAQAQKNFREMPFRPPALAGPSYPADPAELSRHLQAFIEAGPPVTEAESGRGVLSPHIDYYRGGPVYAQVWKRAAKLARQADCVVIFGTDHNSARPGQLTPTRQNYATPYGVLPTDQGVVDAIVSVLGEESAFAEELNHRREHSIELAAVWLHFIRGGKPCPIVPVLCGSFHHFIANGHRPAGDDSINATIAAIKQATAGKNVLAVAAGDLAHLGPAFDTPPLDSAAQAQLKTDDAALMTVISRGDPDAFFEIIRQEKGERNVCGTPPLYLAMKLLGQTAGEVVAYDYCPADETHTSFVSICGMVFS